MRHEVKCLQTSLLDTFPFQIDLNPKQIDANRFIIRSFEGDPGFDNLINFESIINY
ncbi:hypothetical protein TTHERM_00653990 (macronuclear) [Tetrahymena thermophila SB210]|uniref:Uncharacterized protein n=1 Tax=Tetrahymena thermophila (strain SB210) TaxID=312017 RepID=Q23AX8_TETTS|nr:hypothetical protein TTHERM_00653990 [Tetrahymena thermophila SB210]EAR93706.1 hypothetical protein TTHERM_00653990 [Tetrahymena thermophila SB210]|eukprot:XP_001013951.1 hypothetical protein TTHERM_00653990 [Tetrahymena thermophila SB210]